MNTECERFVPLIVRSVDGTLAAGQQAELDAHLASCPACRDALQEQTVVSRLVGELELVPGPADFAARVRARVAPGPGVFGPFDWRTWSLRLAPVAAALVLLTSYSLTTPAGAETSLAIVDDWAMARAEIADGALISPTADRDALLAAALGEASP